jgi:hypothetical protein
VFRGITQVKSAVKVLDELENASKLRVPDLPDHVIAVHIALRGKPSRLVEIGSFIKCPVQIGRGRRG